MEQVRPSLATKLACGGEIMWLRAETRNARTYSWRPSDCDGLGSTNAAGRGSVEAPGWRDNRRSLRPLVRRLRCRSTRGNAEASDLLRRCFAPCERQRQSNQKTRDHQLHVHSPETRNYPKPLPNRG